MPRIVVALFAIWFAFGPVVPAWAQSGDTPCESMNMSTPADGCCGDDMNQAKCLSACLSVSPAIAFPGPIVEVTVALSTAVPASSFRHASVLAPPDAAPPKTFVS